MQKLNEPTFVIESTLSEITSCPANEVSFKSIAVTSYY